MYINGIEFNENRLYIETVRHWKHLHKVMKCESEDTHKAWDGLKYTYYILESRKEKEYYTKHGLSAMTNKDWVIITCFDDPNEVLKFLRWIKKEDHEPYYETFSSEEFVDMYSYI